MSNRPSLDSFLLEDELIIQEGKGGLPQLKIDNKFGSALISIYGAHVLSFKSKAKPEHDLLFVSESAYFEQGKAIKGGIPICWPWFGRDTENLGRQIHGFVRNMLWQLEETESLNGDATKVVLSLSESDESYKHWPHDFKLILTVIVGKTLRLSLETVNTGKNKFTITQALHAYFLVGDISQTQVSGLSGVKYINTVNGANKLEAQEGKISVNEEVDRIYTDVPARTVLIDKNLEREVLIDSKGSKTTVVWNPWIDISKSSEDLTNDAYRRFICVETANAAKDIVVVEPNNSFTIEAEYTIT